MLVAGAQAAAADRVDLAVRVTGPVSVLAGQDVEYVVRVSSRAGPAQRSLRLTATLPRALEGVRFAPATGRYDRSSGTWRGVLLTRHRPLVLRVRATVAVSAPAGPTRLSFRLAPRPGAVEIAKRDNTASATTHVRRPVPVSDLGVVVDDGRTEATSGSSSTYVVTVTNAGPAPVRAARVRLTLPSSLESVAFAEPSAGRYDAAAATWADLELAAGASATLRFSAAVTAAVGTRVIVVAALVGAGSAFDPNRDNDSATDVTSVVAPVAPPVAPGPVPVPGPPPPP